MAQRVLKVTYVERNCLEISSIVICGLRVACMRLVACLVKTQLGPMK
jgi:hypothetical protein